MRLITQHELAQRSDKDLASLFRDATRTDHLRARERRTPQRSRHDGKHRAGAPGALSDATVGAASGFRQRPWWPPMPAPPASQSPA